MTKYFLKTASAGIPTTSDADRELQTSQGSGASTHNTTTVAGPANVRIQITGGADGGGDVSFWAPAFGASKNISGTITFNIWANESAMTVNAGLRVVIERCDSAGTFISTVVDSSIGVELGTSSAAQNWTDTATSTTFSSTDRMRVYGYYVDAGGTMTSGTATMTIGGAAGVNGDSYVDVTLTDPVNFVARTNPIFQALPQ